ncbi:MAG TPA: hypothetical protein VI911_04310 [Patescibacteria group bacterium]|nr:hypothetical protein [Patescibacteria group bacterium]
MPSDPMLRATGTRGKRAAAKPHTPSKQRGIPPSAQSQWQARKQKAGVSGVSLGKDPDGYYAYRGKIRTSSYKRPASIPLGAIRFVATAKPRK